MTSRCNSSSNLKRNEIKVFKFFQANNFIISSSIKLVDNACSYSMYTMPRPISEQTSNTFTTISLRALSASSSWSSLRLYLSWPSSLIFLAIYFADSTSVKSPFLRASLFIITNDWMLSSMILSFDFGLLTLTRLDSPDLSLPLLFFFFFFFDFDDSGSTVRFLKIGSLYASDSCFSSTIFGYGIS